jgi:hypothetical protein
MTLTILLGVVAVGVAVGALVAALMALQAVRTLRARHESLETSFGTLRRELEMVASIRARTGRRVQRVEHEYSDVADRVDVVESRAPTSGSGALDQAIEWARRGADTDKLVEQFGLSSGEAELVARLHGQGRKKSA